MKKKDEEIVCLVLKEPDFYAELICRYEKKITNYILRISNISRDDAEDLVQDVFLSAYEKLNSFNREMSFSSWIYRIAHNITINFWKKHEKEFNNINIEDNVYIVDSFFNEKTVETDIEYIENKEMVEKILKEIPKKYSEVLILKFLEEKDYREMSDILEKPMGSIATLMNRAKKQFKKKVEEFEKEFYDKKK